MHNFIFIVFDMEAKRRLIWKWVRERRGLTVLLFDGEVVVELRGMVGEKELRWGRLLSGSSESITHPKKVPAYNFYENDIVNR